MSEPPIDLSSCDAEPIHVPGSIQPHGALVAMREPGLVVVASANVGAILGLPEVAYGRPLAALVGAAAGDAVARALGADDLAIENPLRLDVGGRIFEGVLHRNGTVAILELEPPLQTQPPVDRRLRDAVTRVQRTRTVADLCAVAAKQLRALTGFERVMVYQFHGDGHGEVVAEDRAPEVESFLGLHYPASDIPRQARQLYLLNPIRIIPDARYTPVPLLGPKDGGEPAPLDLTFASLRAVSPVHLQYLANMGVRASMSVSVMRGDKLWGLLACHHRESHPVPFVVRSACEAFGRLVSLQLDALEELGTRVQRDALRGGESVIVEAMRASPDGWASGLLARPGALLRVVNATGAALIDENGVRSVGDAPSIPDIAALGTWLAAGRGGVFATHALGREAPAAAGYRSVASGLLAVRVAKPRPAYILWFRHEVLRTATWGGDPAKPATPGDARLHPRQSFAAWKEIVRGTSAPWTPAEIESAEDVARRAIEVDLEQQIARAEEAVRARDDLVAVVSHDLKNPVNVILMAANVLRLQMQEHSTAGALATLDRVERAAQWMTVLITDLLDLSKIEAGRFRVAPGPCDARALVDDAVALHRPIADERSVRLESEAVEWVRVLADRDRIFQVLGNLLGNAIKFTPRGGVVRVATGTAGGFTRFEVRDEGPGIAPHLAPHVFDRYWQGPLARLRQGSGLGLYIAKGLVEAHGGRIWVESAVGVGSTFYFTVPSA
jgi:light-regulated signal transduction histidine kinase (bacteriophytochrome)